MVNARVVDGLLNVHAVIDDIHDDLKNRVDDRWASRCPESEIEFPILQHKRRRHGRKRTFTWLNGILCALQKPVHVLPAYFGSEIIHLVVEQNAGALCSCS
jgi:hypothetical protein